jgi:hypothetical protein
MDLFAKKTRTYLINALGSPKSLKRRPFRKGQTIYEMASSNSIRQKGGLP